MALTVALAAALAPPPAVAAPEGDPAAEKPAAEAPPPDAVPATREAGRRLVDAGDFAGAADVLAAVVAAHPDDGAAWFLLGFARHGAKDHRAALVAHRRAATFPAFRSRALYNVTCSLAALGETDAALDAFREAVAAGFRDRGLVATDADVAPLRKDPRFAQILRPLLRGAAAFVEPVRVLHELDGDAPGAEYGWVARTVGDLDGDGAPEFAVTAPGAAGGGGRVTVHSGRTAKVRFTAGGRRGDRFGNIVAAAGDVDGDGTGDVVVGAVQGASAPGYVVVLSGKTGEIVRRIDGAAPGDGFGLKACGVGDLDGDGRAEIAVTAWTADLAAKDAADAAQTAPSAPGPADAGAVTIHSGRTGAVMFRLTGERADERFGSAVASGTVPAASGGGSDRLLAVGAMNAGPGARGRVVVYRITAAGASPAFTIDAPATGVDLGQYFVAFAGDVDGDGAGDIVASDFADAALGPGTGRVLVASGRTGEVILDLPGARAGEGFGSSCSVCGDVDRDGRADLIVGAWQNGDGAPSGGRATLVSGRDGRVLSTWTSRMDQETFGFDAVGLGDLDGDGAADFLVTSGWSEVHGPRTGRVWVLAGPKFPAAGSPAPGPESPR